MPRDLTPDKPAKWWVWVLFDDEWREIATDLAAIYHCRNNRIRFGKLVRRPIITLSETAPTWRPEK